MAAEVFFLTLSYENIIVLFIYLKEKAKEVSVTWSQK
jgi:uncharacterized sporulation protein YeaH/YhbH (DUF444 family)